MEKNEHKRDGFRSRSGFIIACIGSAVGMGNIWRFPMLVSTWGGLTFLLPYFIFVILIASTGVIEEFALGRAGGAGPMGSFGMCTELRYGKRRIGERIGYIPILGSLALAIGYTCVMGWIFKYTFLSFTGDLFSMGQDMDVINGTFGGTASAWGANIWIIVAIAASFAIMSFGIAGGIEKANKVMMPVLFALFLALGVYIFTLDGSSDGYKYILTINPKGLADPKLWIYAFGQAFFSLSVAGNGGHSRSRLRGRAVHSGHRVRVDGCRFDIHLPSRRAYRRGHVLLDRRKEVCARRRQPRRAQAHRQVVLSLGQIRLLRLRAHSADCRRSPRRHRLTATLICKKSVALLRIFCAFRINGTGIHRLRRQAEVRKCR